MSTISYRKKAINSISPSRFKLLNAGRVLAKSWHMIQLIFFQDWGIVIPEGPFYLQSIDLIQQLNMLGVLPSSLEQRQHMEVDFIQIIEGKEQ
jgi:hypothetical protein